MANSFKKYPAVFTVFPLALGILASYLPGKELIGFNKHVYIMILALICIFAISAYILRDKHKTSLFLFPAALIVFGFLSFQFRNYYRTEDNISEYAKGNSTEKTMLRGVITENPEIKTESNRLLLDEVSIDGKAFSGMVLATVYRNKFKESDSAGVQYGDIVEIDGRLEPLPHKRNPGEFDYGNYLKLHDIDAVFYTYGFEKINVKGADEQSFYKQKIINPVKEYSIKVIDNLIGGNEGEYLKGLVLGERSNISKEIKEEFINAGVAHIIAVSGLNVAYVIIIIWAFLTFIPIKQNYKILITILFLLFYMNLTGNTPSIIRATIMASLFLIAQVFERKTNSYNIIAFSALVILLYDPRQMFDAGFILSYSAILSLIIIYPRIEKLLRMMKWYRDLNTEKAYGKAIRFVLALLFGTLAAQLGTLPITAIMFKKISIVSLVVNIFAIPLSNVALAAGFLMIIASLVSSWLAALFAAFNVLLLSLQLRAIAFCAALDYAFIETYFLTSSFLVIYYLLLIILFSAHKKNLLPRFVIAILILINFVIYSSAAERTGDVKLSYIDVGNSSSTFIKMPEGTNILINAGSSTERYLSSERTIIPYLKTEGVNSIDILIINSLNYNEYKSLVYLTGRFPVKRILIPVYYKPVIDNERAFMNSRIEFVYESDIINKRGNFRLYIYYPGAGSSMMTEFVYGEQSFIFNDSYDINSDYVNTKFLPDDNALMLLKVSGSGSFNYNSADFIAKADPGFIVISSSDRGRKKAESDLFSKVLYESGYTVLKTSEEGAIIFESDGYEMKRVKWK